MYCIIECHVNLIFFTCSILAFQPNYGDQSGMGMMSSGLGLGYDRGQFTSGHGPPHGMLRQKSIGEAVCSFCLPLLWPVCLSSGAAEINSAPTCLSCLCLKMCTLSVTLSVSVAIVCYTCTVKTSCLFVLNSPYYYLLYKEWPLIFVLF